MALPYIKPGVTISENTSPQLTPVLLDPNVIGIVGPGRGYEEHVETFVLADDAPVTLSASNPDPATIVVRDASDVTLAPFTKSVYQGSPNINVLADYDVDTSDLLTTGQVSIARSMQTAIANGEEVVAYYETGAGSSQSDGHTVLATLTDLDSYLFTVGAVATLIGGSIKVAREGELVAAADYTVAGAGGATPTIVWVNTSTRASKFQTVYVDYSLWVGTFTVTIANPAVFTKNGHGYVIGDEVKFTTTGALPTGLVAGTSYYVIAAGLTSNAFEVSATPGGSAVVTSGSQSGTHTVTLQNRPTAFIDQPVQFNNVSVVGLPPSADNVVVKTAPGLGQNSANAQTYTKSTTEEADYTVTGTLDQTRIRRSQGSTTIGGLNDKLTVRVSYQATPADYYLPTRCFSQADVEDKFGAAFGSDGAVLNPLALGTLFAFTNGATQVVAQALFGGSLDAPVGPTGALADWDISLERLRSVQDISILVPIVSSGDLATSPSDNLSLQVFQAVQTHIRYMQAQENQFILGIFGEDGTTGGLATPATLQAHAEGLGQGINSESVMLLAPSSFTYANPVTGVNADIGGQYVAAGVAGLAARYPVQMPLTRKRINGLSSLKLVRTETQKDQDAQSGLAVVENKRGRIQVRHSITTNQDTRAQQEFSVVRAKYWMMKNLVEALDTQAVGQLILDAASNFLVQVLVSAELELLIQQGAIVEYDDVQVRTDPSDPTVLLVRFTYRPAYPLNRVVITFSISAEQGVSFDQSTTTQGF